MEIAISDQLKKAFYAKMPDILDKVGEAIIDELHQELDVPWDGHSKHPDPTPPWRRSSDLQESFDKDVGEDYVRVYSNESIADYGKYLEEKHPFIKPINDKILDIVNPVIKDILSK